MEEDNNNCNDNDNKDNENNVRGNAPNLRYEKLKKLKETKNMIFIKNFSIINCQGESKLFGILSNLGQIDMKLLESSVNHTRITRDNRIFVIVFQDSVDKNQIEQWANVINGARINALGPNYQAFKYSKDYYKNKENEKLNSVKSVIIKGLSNESPQSLQESLVHCGYKVKSVEQWTKFNNFTVELESPEEAKRLANAKSAKLGTQQATFELERPRKPQRPGRPIQCTNCQQFYHTSKLCRNKTRCRYCTKAHKSANCPIKNDKRKYKCINCNQKHAANNKRCIKYQKICERMGLKIQSPRQKNVVAILRGANLRNRIFAAPAPAPEQQRRGSPHHGLNSQNSRSYARAASLQQPFSGGSNDITIVANGIQHQNGLNSNFNSNSNQLSIQFDDNNNDDAPFKERDAKKRRLIGGKSETQTDVIARLRVEIAAEKATNAKLQETIADLSQQLQLLRKQVAALAAAKNEPQSNENGGSTDEDIEINIQPNSKGKGKGKSKTKAKAVVAAKANEKSKLKSKSNGNGNNNRGSRGNSRGAAGTSSGASNTTTTNSRNSRSTRRSNAITMEAHEKKQKSRNGSTSSKSTGTTASKKQ